ncbi:methylated-DNA--[protein]-cysteine S-methyltransferase [Pendulispora albinea]|uniref:DNA-3-methyladenine glycosylase II n=1 Tax=Pendulispora albinea TaxID=2741071 RepID=A0ABZ2LRA2_9BACT
MAAQGFALFDTAIGRCGIAWGARGVVGVQLPEAREDATRARLVQRFPEAIEGAPSPAAQRARDGIVALLAGEAGAEDDRLAGIALDMVEVPPFHRRVYEVARTIAPGATLSYGEIATRMGAPGSARAVGQALGRNPFAIVVPCHRVLTAGGKVGGFSANGGITTKLRLLSIERARAAATTAADGDGVLGFDPVSAVAHVRASDPSLSRIIDAVGPCRLRLDPTVSVFFALAEAIVYQQLTTKAAATIFARVRALFPRAHEGPTAEQILRASDEKLLGAGLSRAKLLALRDLARKAKAGEIPTLAEVHAMDDEAIVERLTQVRGIGRWTVEMLLVFRLGRPDVLPVDDYGIRKGLGIVLGKSEMPGTKEVAAYGERWRPYRTVASWYLWRALELPASVAGAAPSPSKR